MKMTSMPKEMKKRRWRACSASPDSTVQRWVLPTSTLSIVVFVVISQKAMYYMRDPIAILFRNGLISSDWCTVDIG